MVMSHVARIPDPAPAIRRAVLFCAALVLPVLAQPTVEEIEIQGDLRRVAESLILTTIGLEPGVHLSQDNVQEAVRALDALQVFSDIQLWAEPGESPQGLKLIVVVQEYPTLEGLRFRGQDELDEKDLEEEIDLVVGQVVAPRDVARGRQRILEMYGGKGYLRAEVEGQLFDGDEEGSVILQYDIVEGDKVKIAAIEIHGNEAFDDGELRKQMETKPKRWYRKGEFQADVFEEDKQRILAFYRSEGYQQAVILRDSIYYDDSRRRLYIDLEVDEGRRYFVRDLAWEGNELFTDEELAREMKVGWGDVFAYSATELAFLAKGAYYERGYLDTEVIPHERIHADSIDVTFQVFEGEPWRIRRIDFAGNVKTREKVLRRELALRPGEVFKSSQLQESQRRLYMLGFFKDVQVQDQASVAGDEKLIDLTFNVEEQRTGAASMGAGYSDTYKLVGNIGLQIPNFRGQGQSLDFNWEFGTRRKQFLMGFTEPWLFDTPTTSSVRVYSLTQQYLDAFDFHRNSISVRLGRRLKKPAFASITLGYQLRTQKYTDFSSDVDASLPQYEPQTTSSLEVVFRRDTRDLPDFPTRGSVISYTPEVASSFIAGDVDFHRHELTANIYRPGFWRFVLALETKFALIDGFSPYDDTHITFWDKFTPGGVDWWDGQVRGYPDASLGPRNDDGSPLGGRSMMTVNLEYRFPITGRQVVGLVFADAGNAWAGIRDFNPVDLRRSAGIGFRVITPMLGMIGFDFGYGFDRRKVDGRAPGMSTHFQFGPRFF